MKYLIVNCKIIVNQFESIQKRKLLVYFMNNQLYEVHLDKENKILTISGLYYVNSVSLHLPSTY